jgi:regulator of RNase E activity RraA
MMERCRAIATSTWSDALDRCGIRGVIEGLTLRSGSGCVAGLAVTVKETVGDYPVEAFAVGEFLDAIGPGTILTIALGGASVSTFGGLAARAAVQSSAAGVIIDGACRDLGEIQATGLWLASRHVTPSSGKGRIKVDGINVPVEMAGIAVRPGDMLIGDATGVVCVPADRLDQVLAVAEELSERDARFAEGLREGGRFGDIAARLRHL